MTTKEIYESIDQSKISPKGKDFLQKAEKSTKGFTIENEKLETVMRKIYKDLKERKPEALKNVKVKTVEVTEKVPTTKSERKKEPKKTTKTVKRKVKKASGTKKNPKPTKTPSTPKEGKKEHISTRASKLAKKEGITFKEARAKISKLVKEESKKAEKQTEKELDKLLKFVRKESFEGEEKYPKTYGKQKPESANLSQDAKRRAKPVGKRVSKNGKTYYEYRDNRSDRNSLPAPKGQYRYKGKTPPFLEAGGTLPTPFGQAGLVGETGAMNEMDLFAMGGGLPQGVHQYYANTYNPAYPTPQGYAKGGYIVEDGKVMLNGNKIGSYQFDRDSNSFWIYDGVKDRSFEEKQDIIDYFENRNFAKSDSVKHHLDKADSHLREAGTKLYDNKNPKEAKFRKAKNKFDDSVDDIFTRRELSELGYAKGGMVSSESIEEMVMSLPPNEYENFAIRFNIDPDDANEMSSFIYGLDESQRDFVHNTLKTKNYAKGGELSMESYWDMMIKTNLDRIKRIDKIRNQPIKKLKEDKFNKNKSTKEIVDNLNELKKLRAVYKADNNKLISNFGGVKKYSEYLRKEKNENTLPFAKGGKISLMELSELDPDGNTGVLYDQDSKEYYWEDYKNDVYRDGFENKKDAYNSLIQYLKSYAKGGEIDAYYSKMVEKLGKDGAFERVLKDSQFGRKKGQTDYQHNRLNKSAIINDGKVFLYDNKPKGDGSLKYSNKKTFTSPKELAEYLDENQIYAKGGEIDAFIMSYVKGVPEENTNLRVDTQNLTAKLKKGGKLGYAKGGEVSRVKNTAKLSASTYKGKIKGTSEYHSIRNQMYDNAVKKGFFKDTDDNFEEFDKVLGENLDVEYFAKGGEIIEYSKVYEILESKIEDAVADIYSTYENSEQAEGQEVEYKSRDGFIPFTNGGYSSRWFEYSNMLEGSGISLPTKSLEDKIEEFRENNREYALERFEEDYPKIVEELGGIDNINYNSLIDAGYNSEAEELDEFDRDSDDSIMMEVEAYYYNPNNDRGEDGKHTIQLSGVVNLEAPYHRSGNLEDYVEERFTFDSYKELEDKLDKGLAKVVSWFEGDMYDKNPRELKIRRMEAGGTLPTPFGQAGLVGETGAMNEMDLFAMGGTLPQGVHQYYANTYNPAYPTPHGYAKGGEITSKMYDPEIHYQVVVNDDYDSPLYFKTFASAKKYTLANVKNQDNTIISPQGDSIEVEKNQSKKDLDFLFEYSMAKGGYTTYIDKGYVAVDIHKKSGDYVFLTKPTTKKLATAMSNIMKRKKGSNQYTRKVISFKEAKKQGYNDKLDESLGNTKGKRSTKEQNYKDRRNESEAMEKKGGKRKYARVKTMDKGTRKKRKTPMTLAKAIRRDGEKWQDAVKRATIMMKKEK